MANTFAADVSKWVNLKAKGNTDKVIRSTIIQLATTVIKRSPVDKGRFRNNWFSSIWSPNAQVTTRIGKSGSARIADATKIAKTAPGKIYYLTNNLPYAAMLEFGGYSNGPKTTNGYSRQAPYGMVRITVREFNQIVKQEARKVNK